MTTGTLARNQDMRTANQSPKSGDRAAYSKIISDSTPALLRAARRMCSSTFGEDSAQDLVQDALIQGYEAFLDGRFVQGTNAKAWLLRILTNRFINNYRHDKRWNSGVDVDSLSAPGVTVPQSLIGAMEDRPDTAIILKTLDEPLELALASLSEEMRLCVILVDIEGTEYALAAEMLGIPIGTVRSRLSRARASLHTLLYDYALQRRRV